jgi:hypothetical protein
MLARSAAIHDMSSQPTPSSRACEAIQLIFGEGRVIGETKVKISEN